MSSIKENEELNNTPYSEVPPVEEIISGVLVSENNLSLGSGNEYGYYSLEPWGSYVNIMYTDYETRKQTVLCKRPDCKHNDESCVGCEVETANTPSLLALQDRLVYIYPGNSYDNFERGESLLPRIDVSKLDGSDKKTIVTYESNTKINVLGSVAYDNENLYIIQEIIGDKAIKGLRLQQVNLDTGNIRLVAEFADLSNQNFFFMGAATNNFVFKRILAGVWDEVLEGTEQWNQYMGSQAAEIFTINSRGEASEALLSYAFGDYTDEVGRKDNFNRSS